MDLPNRVNGTLKLSCTKKLWRLVAVGAVVINLQSCMLGVARFPTRAPDFDRQGNDKYSRGDYISAIADWDQAIQLDPENADYWWKRSRANIRVSEREEQAIADSLRSIEFLGTKDPRKLAFFYLQLGEAYAKKAKFTDSTEAFDKAVELTKGTVDAAPILMERGRVAVSSGNLKKGIDDLTKAIAIVPTLGRAYYFRGKAYEAIKDQANAAKDYKAAATMGYQPVDDLWEPLPITN